MADVAGSPSQSNSKESIPIEIAESELQETDVFQTASNPNLLVDYEVKHRIARVLRHIAAHFDSYLSKDLVEESPIPEDELSAAEHVNGIRLGHDFSKVITSLLVKDDFIEANHQLCEALNLVSDHSFFKSHMEDFNEYFSVMTGKKSAQLFLQYLRNSSSSKDQLSRPTTATSPISVLEPATLKDLFLQADLANVHHSSVAQGNFDIDTLKSGASLRAWHRRLGLNVHAAVDSIVRSSSLLNSPSTPVSAQPRTPSTPEPILFLLKNGTGESSDPNAADISGDIALLLEETFTWKLFKKLSEYSLLLSREYYVAYAQRLNEVKDAEKAISVLNTLPSDYWDMETYKLAINLYLNKRPKDINAARHLVDQSNMRILYVQTSNLDGTVCGMKREFTDADRQILWLHLMGLHKEAKWTECAARYEEARANSDEQSMAFLDDAIIQVSIMYRQYDYGWQVYENMRVYADNTPAVIVTLCWKAFFSKGKDDQRAYPKDQLLTWEARAWAVFAKVQALPDSSWRRAASNYVKKRLIEIVRESPDEESRATKLSQLAT